MSMEIPQSSQTPPNGEKASNKIPWKLISILLFIIIMYSISLSFWTSNLQEKEEKWNWDNDRITLGEDTQDQMPTTKQYSVDEMSSVDTSQAVGKSDLKDKVTWKYKKFASFLQDDAWNKNMKNASFSNIWGDENIFPISNTSVKVIYPKGSYKPSVSPRGGAGFIYSLWENYEEVHLSYDIEFADNFTFVKWGKLPGLCWGSCPRGSEKGEGISVNLWWNKEENLWISVIWSGGKTLLDETLGTVSAGKKYTISLWVKLSTPNETNGSVVVDINGKNVLKQENILLRGINDFSVDSLFFSTFFWWSDASWATPVDTSIIFSNFKIYGTKK